MLLNWGIYFFFVGLLFLGILWVKWKPIYPLTLFTLGGAMTFIQYIDNMRLGSRSYPPTGSYSMAGILITSLSALLMLMISLVRIVSKSPEKRFHGGEDKFKRFKTWQSLLLSICLILALIGTPMLCEPTEDNYHGDKIDPNEGDQTLFRLNIILLIIIVLFNALVFHLKQPAISLMLLGIFFEESSFLVFSSALWIDEGIMYKVIVAMVWFSLVSSFLVIPIKRRKHLTISSPRVICGSVITILLLIVSIVFSTTPFDETVLFFGYYLEPFLPLPYFVAIMFVVSWTCKFDQAQVIISFCHCDTSCVFNLKNFKNDSLRVKKQYFYVGGEFGNIWGCIKKEQNNHTHLIMISS